MVMQRPHTSPGTWAAGTVAPVPTEVVGGVVGRLRRSGAEVAAVERMLLDGQDCAAVIGQLSTAIAALEQAGFALLAGGVGTCLGQAGDGQDAAGPRSEAARRLFERLLLRMP